MSRRKHSSHPPDARYIPHPPTAWDRSPEKSYLGAPHGVVLRAAKSVRALPVDPKCVQEARNACRELRLIGKSKKRSRRPTPEELTKLAEFFRARDRRSVIPMGDIVQFAIASARREAEICRLEWTDNDNIARSGLVRDAKHPREKEGNHRRFKYTQEAWAIVQRQPAATNAYFPTSPKAWVTHSRRHATFSVLWI
jgi:integrase